MNLSLDAEIIFLLLGLGYLFTLVLLIAYEYKYIKNLFTNTFFIAKLMQAVAWFCLLDGGISGYLSISFANSLLFISYTLEIMTLLNIKEPLHKKTKKAFFIFTLLSVIGFQLILLFHNSENIQIAYYSFVTAVIFLSSYRLVFGKANSLLTKILGSVYLIFAMESFIRGVISITSSTLSTSLFTPGAHQLILLASIFIFTNLGSIGYILLKMEKIDDLMFYLASYDDLTGILNRRTFTETAKQYLLSYAEKKQFISYILFDVDIFKKVNDTFGHHMGDQVLQDLAMRIKEHLDEDDLFGRYGGDEFAILMPGKNVAESTKIAEKIKRSLNDNRSLPVPYTISMGVITTIPNQSTKLEMLYTNCDNALYKAKNNGRNGIYRAQLE